MENVIKGGRVEVLLSIKKQVVPECFHSGEPLTCSLMCMVVPFISYTGNLSSIDPEQEGFSPWGLLP